jgi:hypothetical protein
MSADDDRTVIRPTGPPAPPSPSPTDDRTQQVGRPAPVPDHGNGLPVGMRLGEFEITRLVGEGGFGIVYEAHDHSLQRRVALKEYMPSALASRAGGSQVQVKSERHRETFEVGRKSFVNEARLLAQFDHPSLVKVYRFWEANGTAYMVMPFIEGVTLKDALREMDGRPDEAWLRALLEPLTEALMVIHAEQCYHRDIAPDNIILLAGTGRPLLVDFGAARHVIGDMTQALTVILKPGYAPLEQYAEIPGMKQGPWTDVYALAAVVYHAITGRTPPPSIGRLVNDTFEPLSRVSAGRYGEAFLAAIDRALAVRPENRTQSVEQLRAELGFGAPAPAGPRAATATAPVAAPPSAALAGWATPPAAAPAPSSTATAPSPAPSRASRSPLVLAGAAGAVLVAGASTWFLLAPSPTPAPAPPAPSAEAASAATPTSPPPPAVAAAPPPLPPPAAPVGLDPSLEFERVVAGQTPGFGVRASARSNVLRIGRDDLAFTVDSDRQGYLYVFAFGADGALVQLLPNTVSGSVRVRPGRTFRFPTGDGVVLTASDPPGPGQLLVIVSALQRDHGALDPKREGAFRFFPTGAAAAPLLASLSGGPPPLAGRAICPASGPCDESYGAAVILTEAVR